MERKNKMWLKPTDNKRGNHHRLYVSLGRGNKRYIHRLVAEAFIPNPENKPYIDHIDTDRTNNDVTNLRWVTQEENMRNEQTRENLRKGWEKKKKADEAISLIKQALELVPDKLELIQLVIDCSPKTIFKEMEGDEI